MNGLKTKIVKRDLKIKEPSPYSSSNFINKFVVTRILGHPECGADLEKWREAHECWICAKYAYYAVFYSKSLRELYFYELDLTDPNHRLLSSNLVRQNRDVWAPSTEDGETAFGNPRIAGTFNSWKFERMHSLQEACKMFDRSGSIEVPEALKKPEYKRSK